MATKIWQATTGAWDTAGNWSGATVPVDGDDVRFTGSSVESVTSGLTLGGAGDALASLYGHADYTGSIGTSGGKLIATSITTLRWASRGGKIFVDSTITNAILQAPGGVTDFAELDGTITNIWATGCAGSWSVTAGAAVTSIEQVDSPNCTCTINTGVTALNRVICASGKITNNSAVLGTTNPGLVHVVNSVYQHEVGGVEQMLVGAGGVVKFNSASADTTSSKTIEALRVLPGGIFDGRSNSNVGTAPTIVKLWLYPGSRAILNTGLDNWVVTNLYQIGGGGQIDIEPLNQVAI